MTYKRSLNKSSSFEYLFFKREYDALTMRSGSGIGAMSIILLLTLLALAFALGSWKKLDQRMNDPFTNWVNLPLSRTITEDQLRGIRTALQRHTFLDSFHLTGADSYVVWQELFKKHATSEHILVKGRNLDSKSELFKKILDPESDNVIAQHTVDPIGDFEACGIIITRQALETLGYIPASQQLKVPMRIDDYTVWMNIVAVVESLPDLCDFAASATFYAMLTEPLDRTGFLKSGGSTNVISILSEEEDATMMEKQIREAWPQLSLIQVQHSKFAIRKMQNVQRYDLILSNYETTKALVQLWENSLFAKRQGFFLLTPTYCNDQFQELEMPYYYAFHFKRLDRVRAFKAWLSQSYGIEISMDQIEAKENFAIVGQLTLVTSLVLFAFGITCIVLFITSLLRTHLEKIKPDLGTCKAFGLSDRFLIHVYTRTISVFLSNAVWQAGLICFLVALSDQYGHRSPYFLFTHWAMPCSVVFIFVICLWVSRRAVSHMLSATPGNLVYGR